MACSASQAQARDVPTHQASPLLELGPVPLLLLWELQLSTSCRFGTARLSSNSFSLIEA